jgi:hypothetical protein
VTARELDARARELYEAVQTPKPTWDQLGDVTKSVWREEAQRRADLDSMLE